MPEQRGLRHVDLARDGIGGHAVRPDLVGEVQNRLDDLGFA